MKKEQMTGIEKTISGASSVTPPTWNSINWNHVEREIKRLQMRIAKAVREKRYGKAKALQWRLTHSFAAKLLAIRKVTQNKGAKTPGVDGVVWKTEQQKMQAARSLRRRGYKPQPLRRIYIPKKNGGKRPLSIPCMIDRGMQALHYLALEPVMETEADKNSYGFRPKRSCADAIDQVFIALVGKTSASWILEGDIRACFDQISGKWLHENILMDKLMLTKWLTAGYVDKNVLHQTFDGVPQGGIISPALLVLTLKGLEEMLKKASSRKDKIHLISYADDFIITGSTKEVLENKVMPLVNDFLRARGLELSTKKTKIVHVDEGFDFLGFTIRKYKGKLIIKPSKKSVKHFLGTIRAFIKSNPTITAETLIRQLNPKIRGWTNYHRHVVAKETFSYVDHCIFKGIMQWIGRRHPKKSANWKYTTYFRTQDSRKWIFSAKTRNKKGKQSYLDLFRASQVPIRRHIKVKAEANPFDPKYTNYFLERERSSNERRVQDRKVLNSNLKIFRSQSTNSRVIVKNGL